ncbi:arginase family protein [Rhodanobacter sp. AS-Z3]|uniref:arginase family protein n=1 Tax=Rhodanobacter sp. AS-Z3 TaxID=3031330 RepID=UPI002478F13A|nr:arginase family protein [Rhodanobacter sp. AS-Z3]WEN16531.1 arginase family protein [Rhodanobacter sp. AS-Z3]
MSEIANRPVVLDIDRSVGPLRDRLVVPLEHWQESLRFACSLATMRRFAVALDELLPADHGTVFLGSGDFHHLSWPLIARLPADRPFQVVVLDNHPDNMRFPFGVHCGSWVRKVAMLAQVSHVHVLGITSTDIGSGHAWENYLTPLRRQKLTYWSIGVDTEWSQRLGLAHAFRNFDTPEAMVDAFVDSQRTQTLPSYLSIDKDVFAAEVARTNWDQGRLLTRHALSMIDSLRHGLVGSDINGEVSHYRYRSWWKRRLSAMDEQPEIDPAMLDEWQAQQHALNLQLLAGIAARSV